MNQANVWNKGRKKWPNEMVTSCKKLCLCFCSKIPFKTRPGNLDQTRSIFVQPPLPVIYQNILHLS